MHSSGDLPFVTICIPTYRRTTYIRQCLESSLEQTYSHYEIIVHDDTEDDSIKKIVESFKAEKIRYIQNTPPLGLIPKLNDFLVQAKSDWVLILCDDDFLHPDYLKTLSKHIQNYPKATLVRCRYRLINHEGKEIRLDRLNSFRMQPFEFLRDIFLPENQSFKMNISGILFPKALLKQLGGFKNLHRGWHVDRLAWAELGAQGESICDPAPLCNIRFHTSAITSTLETNYEISIKTDLQMKEIVEELFSNEESKIKTKEDKENLRKARAHFQAYLNRHLSKSFDQGFIAALEKKTDSAHFEIDKIFERMRELNVPPFRSSVLYRMMAPLPYFLRSLFLTPFRQYKIKKRLL